MASGQTAVVLGVVVMGSRDGEWVWVWVMMVGSQEWWSRVRSEAVMGTEVAVLPVEKQYQHHRYWCLFFLWFSFVQNYVPMWPKKKMMMQGCFFLPTPSPLVCVLMLRFDWWHGACCRCFWHLQRFRNIDVATQEQHRTRPWWWAIDVVVLSPLLLSPLLLGHVPNWTMH